MTRHLDYTYPHFNRTRLGINIGVIGQSECYPMITGTHAPAHPDLVRVFVGESPITTDTDHTPPESENALTSFSYGWQAVDGYGLSSIADAIHARYPGLPIRFIYNPLGGTPVNWWLTHTKPSQSYGQFISQVKQNVGSCDFVIDMHGEADAAIPTSITQFKSDMKTLYGNILNDLGETSDTLKLVISRIGHIIAEGGTTEQSIADIQQAQLDLIAENIGILDGGSLVGLPTNDGLHILDTAAGAGVIGTSMGNAIADQLDRWAAPAINPPGEFGKQIHLTSTPGATSGAHIMSLGAAGLHLMSGVSFNGTNFIAEATSAHIIAMNGGTISFFTDTGLTPGTSYTPTLRQSI